MYFSGFQRVITVSWPPLLTIESIEYYDGDEVLQTVDPSFYSGQIGVDGASLIAFTSSFTIDSLSTRFEPIQVTITTGYGTRANMPSEALHAVKMALGGLWDADDAAESMAQLDAARSLADALDWGSYV